MKFKLLLFALCLSTGLLAQNTLYFDDTETMYRNGLDLLDKRQYVAAREQFEKYLNQEQDHVKQLDAQYYIAFTALGLYHLDGEKRIEEFIDDHPDHPKAVTAYYELGNFYFKEKKFKKAIEFYEQVNLTQVSDEQRFETRYKLGYSHFASRQLADALNYFNILKRLPGPYAAASNYYAGYVEYQNGEYDKAITDLERAAKDEAYSTVAPELLANLYYKQGNYDKLISYVEPTLSNGAVAKEKDLYVLLGDAYKEKGNSEMAMKYYLMYESVTNNIPRDVRYRIGLTYYNAKSFEESIDHMKRVASADDSIGVYANYYLGVMYLKQGNKLYAQNAFKSTSNNQISSKLREEGAYQYAKVLYDQSRVQDAADAMNKYLDSYPSGRHTDEMNDLLSEAYLNSSAYDLAITQIESRNSISPSLAKVYQKATYLKGSELFNKGDYRNAESYFKKSLKHQSDPKFARLANLWLAETYSIDRRYDLALPHYLNIIGNSSLADKPVLQQARYGLGYAYFNTKGYSKALTYFKAYVNAATTEDAYKTDATLRLADCYYVSKEYDQAINYYRMVASKSGSDRDYAWYHLGLVNGIQSNVREAISAYDKVADFPRSRYSDDALYQKGQVTFQAGDYQRAISYYGDLIRKKPNSRFVPYALLRSGSAHYNLKNYDKTILDYTKIINEHVNSRVASEVLLPLQEVLNIQNRGGEFDQYLSAFKKANPDNKGLENVEYETAKNTYFALEYEKAIRKLDAFIETYPEHPNAIEAKYYKAESYYRLRDFEPALKIYNELLSENDLDQRNRIVGRIAEIEYTSGRYENAIYFYRQLGDLAATKKQQYNVWAGLMESFYLLAKYDSSISYAQTILKEGNVHVSSQNKALLYLGKAAYSKGDYQQAESDLLATVNAARDIHGAEAQYLLGDIYYSQGDYKKSIETLIELNSSYAVYEEWVGKSFLLLADNYVALDELNQAIETLNSIVADFPIEFYRNKAKEKVVKIKAMKTKRDRVAEPVDSVTINEN